MKKIESSEMELTEEIPEFKGKEKPVSSCSKGINSHEQRPCDINRNCLDMCSVSSHSHECDIDAKTDIPLSVRKSSDKSTSSDDHNRNNGLLESLDNQKNVDTAGGDIPEELQHQTSSVDGSDDRRLRHGDIGVMTVGMMASGGVPNFALLDSDSADSDNEESGTSFCTPDEYQDFKICVNSDSKESDSLSSTLSSPSSIESTTVTPTPSPRKSKVGTDILQYIPNILPSFSRNSKRGRPLSGAFSSVGSTAPRENFSTDLVEDGIQSSRPPQLIRHDVQQGSLDDLDLFVNKKVYRADPITGFLVSQKLHPQNIDDEWLYREDHEYTVISRNHPSVCICQDNHTEEMFVRKERKRSKFEGQKKSVLVPLKHDDSPHIMDIYGLIVLVDDVYILMEYCEGGFLNHDTPRPVKETFECVQRILEALKYIHFHGLVHGDIKPENVCLRSREDLTSLCLIDFEFVRTPESQPQFRGFTTQFLPPWWPKLKQSSRVSRAELMSMDLWATACIAICLLTGKRPWSVQVKEFKKQCTSCAPKACTCDLLHRLQNHITEHGKDMLEQHLDRDGLQTTPQGKSLWKALTFLTRNDNTSENKASDALGILTDEEEEKVTVEIHYKANIICETAMESGTSVQQVLDEPYVLDKINSKVKKWMLFFPSPDHKITSACQICIKKEKTHIVDKIVQKLKLKR